MNGGSKAMLNNLDILLKNKLSSFEKPNEGENKKNETKANDDRKSSWDLMKNNQLTSHEQKLEEMRLEKEKALAVDPRDSWEELRNNRMSYVVDIRPEPETIYAGSPDLTVIEKDTVRIPYKLYPSMRTNPEFEKTYKQYFFNKDSVTFLLCKDGTMSEQVASEIREFHENCYAIKNGFNGEKNEESKQRNRLNGWKADGLPCEDY